MSGWYKANSTFNTIEMTYERVEVEEMFYNVYKAVGFIADLSCHKNEMSLR